MVDSRESTAVPCIHRTSMSSVQEYDSKRNDEFIFTCSYVLAWVGICMYFGGLNSEKWL